MRLQLLICLGLGSLPYSISQATTNCANAPTAVLQVLCNQLVNWDNGARTAPAAVSVAAVAPPGSSAPQAALAGAISTPGDLYTCMTLECMCQSLEGTYSNGRCNVNGQSVGPAQRIEYRMMTGPQRNRFHTAMWTIKNNGVYDQLATLHANPQIAAGAHGGAAFLPWHREYIKRMEFALRRVDPGMVLPYWDSTLEGNLPTPSDSILFSEALMGVQDANGRVNSGAFRGWTQLDGTVLQRNVGQFGQPFQEADLQAVSAATTYTQVLAYTAPRSNCPSPADFSALEYSHGNAHVWVGGAMFVQTTASGDPLFWLHHSFVDFIWEMWRQQRQTPQQRETQYPPDNVNCEADGHFSTSIMRPFAPKTNIDGLSNDYTPGLYSYGNRPSCNLGSNCGSVFLFCDRSHGAPRCASQIRQGGNCRGYTNGESMCYNGFCSNGVCVATQMTTQPPIQTTSPVAPTGETCFNENQCCQPWAQNGECSRNRAYMSVWCEASCNVCTPRTYNLNTECSDRHPQCSSWASTNECTKNPGWMSENCRQSCNLCGQTRYQTCFGGGQTTRQTFATTTTTAASSCNSPGCFNENICCSTWASNNYCSRSPTFMSCNCRVSCGYCRPNYAAGSCADYDNNCRYWASIGECGRNAWMRENCKSSCRTCYSTNQLRSMCSTRRKQLNREGKVKPAFKGKGKPGIAKPNRKGKNM